MIQAIKCETRVMSFCRVAPAIVVIAICVTGIALGILWKLSWMSGVSAVGVAGGIFCVYTIYRDGQQKSLNQCTNEHREQNKALEQQISNLKKQGEILQNQLKELEKIKVDLEATQETLKGNISELQKENSDLKQLIEKLKEYAKQLETFLEQYKKFQELNKNHLYNLNASLEKGVEGIYKNHQDVSVAIELFINHEKAFEQQQKNFLSTLQQNDQELGNQEISLNNIAGKMKDVFRGIEEWKKEDSSLRKIELIQELNNQISELNNQLGRKESDKKKLSEEIVSLQEVHVRLEKSLENLKEQIRSLRNENTNLNVIPNLMENLFNS